MGKFRYICDCGIARVARDIVCRALLRLSNDSLDIEIGDVFDLDVDGVALGGGGGREVAVPDGNGLGAPGEPL